MLSQGAEKESSKDPTFGGITVYIPLSMVLDRYFQDLGTFLSSKTGAEK